MGSTSSIACSTGGYSPSGYKKARSPTAAELLPAALRCAHPEIPTGTGETRRPPLTVDREQSRRHTGPRLGLIHSVPYPGERSSFIFRCAVPLGSTMIRVHLSAFTSQFHCQSDYNARRRTGQPPTEILPSPYFFLQEKETVESCLRHKQRSETGTALRFLRCIVAGACKNQLGARGTIHSCQIPSVKMFPRLKNQRIIENSNLL